MCELCKNAITSPNMSQPTKSSCEKAQMLCFLSFISLGTVGAAWCDAWSCCAWGATTCGSYWITGSSCTIGFSLAGVSAIISSAITVTKARTLFILNQFH